MRKCWEALHAGLERSLQTLEVHEQFEEARRRHAELLPFGTGAALVDELTSAGGDLDAKDEVLARLVEMSHESRTDGPLVTALLWLALWPALDRIDRRGRRSRWGDPGELVSDLWDSFWLVVRRADLGRINRVAATLVRNTERTLRDGRVRARYIAARDDELPADDFLEDVGLARRHDLSDLGLPPGLPPEVEAARLRDLVADVVGDDADLVIGAAIYGESQRELADRLGITHEAARKRYQRAVGRLGDHLQATTG